MCLVIIMFSINIIKEILYMSNSCLTKIGNIKVM